MKGLTKIVAAVAFGGMVAGMGSAFAADAEISNAPQIITRAETVKSVFGAEGQFTGHVRIDPMFNANEYSHYTVGMVTFDPKARTYWHTHPSGQRLIVLHGHGLVGTIDGKASFVAAGDTVECPPNVKHFHAAAPDAGFVHYAITNNKDGKSVTWLEEVSDEQYNNAVKAATAE